MSTYRETLASGGSPVARECWMRRIRITFESKPGAVAAVAGKDDEFLPWLRRRYPGLAKLGASDRVKLVIDERYNIKVKGTKNLGLLQDGGVIEISNITYDSIALIIALKLYCVTIEVGYENAGSLFCVAKGEVSWLQQKIRSRHDYNLYISYASELVAAWSQNRINFSIRSGCNLSDMLHWMFIKQGASIEQILIDDRLRRLVASDTYASSGTSADIVTQALNSYAGQTRGLVTRADSSLENKVISISDLSKSRVIKVNENFINIGNGNPTVTANNGLDISLFPAMNFVPGDILVVPSRLIDTSQGLTTATGVQTTFNQNWLNPNGQYVIRRINYTFENRGQTFIFDINAVPVNLYQALAGGV